MAVNSVFGVLENMIDQLEKSNNEGDDDEPNRSEDEESHILSPSLPMVNVDNYKKTEKRNNVSCQLSNIIMSSKHDNNLNDDSKDVVSNQLGKNMEANNFRSSAESSSRRSEVNAVGLDSTKTNRIDEVCSLQKYPPDIALNPYYWGSPYEAYLQSYLSSRFPRPKSSEMISTTDLFLDPQKGQWKMLEQASNSSSNLDEGWKNQIINEFNETQHHSEKGLTDGIIDTSYITLDEEQLPENFDKEAGEDANAEAAVHLVRNSLLDALKVEVGRRLSTSYLKEIDGLLVDDMKQAVDTIAQAVVLDNQLNLKSFSELSHPTSVKFGTLGGEHAVQIISSAIEKTSHLKKVLPVGVIVGSLLASLRKYFKIAASHDHKDDEKVENIQETSPVKEANSRSELSDDEKDQAHDCMVRGDKTFSKVNSNGDGVMIGAVTAALGATALFAHHQQNNTYSNGQVMQVPSTPTSEKGSQHEHARYEEAAHEKNPINIMSNLAEKAISVAGPVVPTKDDGEVDHERLVSTLAELGQKGGLLKLVGKVALLWGGVRGAMSLTDRLISFLHIAERPLLQRVMWFGCMILVLWSPVVIPLLPTLVQSWSMKTSNTIVVYACILSLYVSSMILVVLWGKRIRGYDNPLEQYGLDFTAPRVLGFMKGLVGGMAIIMSIHSINGLLGYASISWPFGPPSLSASPVLFLKSLLNMFLLGFRGLVTATGVALAEELLFRSWLLEEVKVDLGYYPAIMISGIAFSLIHGSLPSVPGFLLLSLALFGIKQRSHDKIYVPIGVRSGIMCTNFILQTGGFINYKHGTPSWLMSTHPLHPFDGVVGLGVCVLLAILFFPKQPQQTIHSEGIQEQRG